MFRTMLDSGFAESRTRVMTGGVAAGPLAPTERYCVRLPDVDVALMRDFLQWLYTGDVDVLRSDNIVDLLVLAARFCADELRSEAEGAILVSLDSSNARDLYELASVHGLPRIERRCGAILSAEVPA